MKACLHEHSLDFAYSIKIGKTDQYQSKQPYIKYQINILKHNKVLQTNYLSDFS